MKFGELVSSFKTSAEWANLTPTSQKAYAGVLARLESFHGGRELLVSMDRSVSLVEAAQEVAAWDETLRAVQGPEARRMARRVLNVVYNWGGRTGVVVPGALRGLPVPRFEKKDHLAFSKEEIEKVRHYAEELMQSGDLSRATYLRAACLAFYTGLRPAELTSLRWRDIRDGYIHVHGAKHREKDALSRMCAVTEDAAKCLGEPGLPDALVFTVHFDGREWKPLNKDTRGPVLKRACLKLGIAPREFYGTRRGTATGMHQAGYDIVEIADQLGHRNIETTKIYLRPTMLQKADKFKGF